MVSIPTSREVRILTDEYRSLPVPGHYHRDGKTKRGSCFVRASDVQEIFGDWMEVNPRMPSIRERDRTLTGKVSRRIVSTLNDSPNLFALKNQGIYLLVEKADFKKRRGRTRSFDHSSCLKRCSWSCERWPYIS